jgi:hypothetical protein
MTYSIQLFGASINTPRNIERHIALRAVCDYLVEKLPGAEIDARHELEGWATIGVKPCNAAYWDKVINRGLKRFSKDLSCAIISTRQELESGAGVIKIIWKAPPSFEVVPWPRKDK